MNLSPTSTFTYFTALPTSVSCSSNHLYLTHLRIQPTQQNSTLHSFILTPSTPASPPVSYLLFSANITANTTHPFFLRRWVGGPKKPREIDRSDAGDRLSPFLLFWLPGFSRPLPYFALYRLQRVRDLPPLKTRLFRLASKSSLFWGLPVFPGTPGFPRGLPATPMWPQDQYTRAGSLYLPQGGLAQMGPNPKIRFCPGGPPSKNRLVTDVTAQDPPPDPQTPSPITS